MRSVDVGTKKELFSRHDKYGVLSWNEMGTVNAADVIRVFSFDNTRMLNSPISLECLKQLIKSTENKEVQLVSPNLVTNTVACKLIEKGMAKRECIS